MKEIKAYLRTTRLPYVLMALEKIEGFPGVSVCEVRGFGGRLPRKSHSSLVGFLMEPNEHVKLEIICQDAELDAIIATIREQAQSKEGNAGKLFVSNIDRAVGIAGSGTGR